jgi:hypothetical protein
MTRPAPAGRVTRGRPLLRSQPVAGAGIKSALLGTAKRKNGKLQVTYKGHLLYLFAEDQKPGQTTGEGLNNFGAKWYALTPKGAVIDRDWRARDTTAHTSDSRNHSGMPGTRIPCLPRCTPRIEQLRLCIVTLSP